LSLPTFQTNKAKVLTAKLKNLKRVLGHGKPISQSLAKTIENNKPILRFMDILEEFKDLSLDE
jgi:hypothetical protein